MPIKWFEFNFNSLTFLNDKWIHCTVATFHCFSSSFYDGVQAQYAKHSTSFKSQRFNTVNERKQTSIFVTFSHHWVCTLVAHYWYIWIDLKENKNKRRNKFGSKSQSPLPVLRLPLDLYLVLAQIFGFAMLWRSLLTRNN